MYETNRVRTRDLLLEYEYALVPQPHASGLQSVYPWIDHYKVSIIDELFKFARDSGYTKDFGTFMHNFGSYLQDKDIIYAHYKDFPSEGDDSYLYFDLTDKILYYWDGEYLPVNAMIIEGTTLEGGGA